MAKQFALIAIAAGILAIPTVSLAQSNDYRGYNTDVECQQRVNNGATTGGLVGAGVGAVAGRSLASRGNRNEGAVLGAVLGAVIGSQVGKNRHACDDQYQSQRHPQTGAYDNSQYGNNGYNQYGNGQYSYGNSQYGNNQYGNNQYGNSQYGNGGYAQSQYGRYGDDDDRYEDRSRRHHGHRNRYSSYNAPIQYSGQNNCGWGTAAYELPNGRVVQDRVYMCRQRNGEWVITNR